MKVRQAYQQYLYSDRFYKLVHENLNGKRTESENLSIFIRTEMFRCEIFEDARAKAENFLALTKYKPISIENGKNHQDKKPMLKIDFNINGKFKIKSLGLDTYIDMDEDIGLVIWLMEDNYVFVCQYVMMNCLCTDDNYKIMELSEFMKTLKNPIELL